MSSSCFHLPLLPPCCGQPRRPWYSSHFSPAPSSYLLQSTCRFILLGSRCQVQPSRLAPMEISNLKSHTIFSVVLTRNLLQTETHTHRQTYFIYKILLFVTKKNCPGICVSLTASAQSFKVIDTSYLGHYQLQKSRRLCALCMCCLSLYLLILTIVIQTP